MTSNKHEILELPVSILRGGTSKGIYILEKDMPAERKKWDRILLRLMGSPDKKQIDGLGGAQSVTSKVAIIKRSDRTDADVDYTFAQVSVDKPIVSYRGNCGNISSGVGPFAVEAGLIEAKDPVTVVRVYNTNTDKIIVEDVQTPGGIVDYYGDLHIAGVPGKAAPVKMRFLDPSGTLGRGLLPTGNPVDILDVPGFGRIEASIVDAANPLVFVRAKDLGLTGKEIPGEIDSDPRKLELLEKVRGTAAVRLGLTDDPAKAAWETPGVPKMTYVAEKDDYTATDGTEIKAEQIDIISHMMSMQKAHPSYAMTGAMCTAAAAVIDGSIVNGVLDGKTDPKSLRIGHPSGILECGVDHVVENGCIRIIDTFGYRTANLLLKGIAVIRL